MINLDDVTKENIKEYNPVWPQIPDNSKIKVIIRGSGSGKTNLLSNLINQQRDFDKICLYAQDPYKATYQFLINKQESTGLKHIYKILKNAIWKGNVKYYLFLM